MKIFKCILLTFASLCCFGCSNKEENNTEVDYNSITIQINVFLSDFFTEVDYLYSDVTYVISVKLSKEVYFEDLSVFTNITEDSIIYPSVCYKKDYKNLHFDYYLKISGEMNYTSITAKVKNNSFSVDYPIFQNNIVCSLYEKDKGVLDYSDDAIVIKNFDEYQYVCQNYHLKYGEIKESFFKESDLVLISASGNSYCISVDYATSFLFGDTLYFQTVSCYPTGSLVTEDNKINYIFLIANPKNVFSYNNIKVVNIIEWISL